MYTDKIRSYFAANTPSMIDDISALVSIKSTREQPLPGKPFGEGPAKALEAALAIGKRMGFNTRSFDNYAGVIEIGDDPKLAILAHLDVVEAGDGWETDPYTPIIKDGCIFGRGTSDDKGPAMAALYAMAAAKELCPELTGVRLVLGCAEETTSECMEYYMSKEALPSMVFSPDAEFPVINIEKGGFAPDFCKSWPEDNSPSAVVFFQGGTTRNIVPGKASAVLRGIDAETILSVAEGLGTGAEFSVTQQSGLIHILCTGKSAHASIPEEGTNAQTALIKLISALPLSGAGYEAICSLNRLFPHGDTCGKALGVNISDEISGSLTLAFSMLKLDSHGLEAVFDARVPICGNESNLVEPVTASLAKEGFTITQSGLRPPHHTPEDGEFVQTLLSSYEKFTGNKGCCIAIGGGTYVHEVEGGVAFGCTMPGTDPHIHGANEFMPINELELSAEIFTDVILRLCK